jgi:hypothetical protein
MPNASTTTSPITIADRAGLDMDQLSVDAAQTSAQQTALNSAYDSATFQQKSSIAQANNVKTGYMIGLGNSMKGLADKVQM